MVHKPADLKPAGRDALEMEIQPEMRLPFQVELPPKSILAKLTQWYSGGIGTAPTKVKLKQQKKKSRLKISMHFPVTAFSNRKKKEKIINKYTYKRYTHNAIISLVVRE